MKSNLLLAVGRVGKGGTKEGRDREDRQWATESIGSAKVMEMQPRPSTVNSTHFSQGNPKRSCFYRRFLNKSVNGEYTPKEQQKTKGDTNDKEDNHQQSPFLPYQYKIINQQPTSERDKECIALKCGNQPHPKDKSFEGFLESKRRKDSLKKRKEETPLAQKNRFVRNGGFEQVEGQEKELNLSGKAISKLKEQYQSRKFFMKGKKNPNPQTYLRTRPESPFMPLTPNRRELSVMTTYSPLHPKQSLSKLYTIQSQADRTKAKQPYIKYVFQQDQGYCFFQKCPYGTAKQCKKKVIPSTRRKLLYFNPKPSFPAPHPHPLETSINRIEGWAIQSHEQEQIPK